MVAFLACSTRPMAGLTFQGGMSIRICIDLIESASTKTICSIKECIFSALIAFIFVKIATSQAVSVALLAKAISWIEYKSVFADADSVDESSVLSAFRTV